MYSTVGEKLILGINTTIIGMLVVFIVLIALCYVIVLQSKFLLRFSPKTPQKIKEDVQLDIKEDYELVEKTGFVEGEAIIDIEDDEVTAAIMAAVSFDADIPLKELKINSIKQIDKNN